MNDRHFQYFQLANTSAQNQTDNEGEEIDLKKRMKNKRGGKHFQTYQMSGAVFCFCIEYSRNRSQKECCSLSFEVARSTFHKAVVSKVSLLYRYLSSETFVPSCAHSWRIKARFDNPVTTVPILQLYRLQRQLLLQNTRRPTWIIVSPDRIESITLNANWNKNVCEQKTCRCSCFYF